MTDFIAKLIMELLGPCRLSLDIKHPIKPVAFSNGQLILDVSALDWRFESVQCKVMVDIVKGVATLSVEDKFNNGADRERGSVRLEVGKFERVVRHRVPEVQSVSRPQSLNPDDEDILGSDDADN